MPRSTVIRILVIAVLAAVAFAALWSADHTTDIFGTVLLVLLFGWVVVDLFRARDRVVK